jgi:hypothetical protein
MYDGDVTNGGDEVVEADVLRDIIREKASELSLHILLSTSAQSNVSCGLYSEMS